MNRITYYLISSCIILSACGERNKSKAPPAPEVNVVIAGQKTIPFYSEYVGQTYGKSDVQIQSRIEGWVMSIHFKEGAFVSRGQLLYTLDDEPVKTRINAAAADLAQANSRLIKFKSDYNRIKPLTDMNALSQRDLDDAVANYDAAKEEVTIAKSRLENTRIEYGYTRIKAPVSGIIGITKVQVGDYVGKSMGIGMPINTISAIGEMRVRFSISESEYLEFTKAGKTTNLKVSLPVELHLSDNMPFQEQGYIDFANREIDPKTGSIILQAVFQNKGGLLRPGQYVKVRIKTGTAENAVIVPQQTVNQIQNIFQVFILSDSNKIQPRTVKTGTRIGSNWVIKEGLKSGEKVAMIGNAIIKPGILVKPVMISWNYDSTSLH